MSISESLLALAIALALPSCTPGGACLRHSDCDRGFVCSDGTCSEPAPAPVVDATGDGASEAEVSGDAMTDSTTDSMDEVSDANLDSGDADAQDVGDSSVTDASDATDGAELDGSDADSAGDGASDSFESGG